MYRDFRNDIGSIRAVTFQYSMYGATMGTVELQGSNNGGSTYTTLWSKSGNQGTGWKGAELTIISENPQVLKFVYISGSDHQGDFALDYEEVSI